VRLRDTVDKIVEAYLAGVCSEPFFYKGNLHKPKPIYVSPLILRGFACPTHCGACCGSFSLDYLPSERPTKEAKPREISVSGMAVPLVSDIQHDVPGPWCRNLIASNGRCRVYDQRPFACDFELIRFVHQARRVIITQKLYGRAWAMGRLDGHLGALCYMTEPTEGTRSEVLRKFTRLAEWADHLGVRTRIAEIRDWVSTADCREPLILEPLPY